MAPRLVFHLWPNPDAPAYAQVLTWPAQPAASGVALTTAVVFGVLGTAAYAILGPRQ